MFVLQYKTLEHAPVSYRVLGFSKSLFTFKVTLCLKEPSQNCQTLLLAYSCLSFLLYVCPSVLQFVRIQKLGSYWTDFHEIFHSNFNRKYVQKIRVAVNCDKNNRHFTWRPTYIVDHISAHFYIEWETFQTKFVEKIETQHLVSIYFFFQNRGKIL